MSRTKATRSERPLAQAAGLVLALVAAAGLGLMGLAMAQTSSSASSADQLAALQQQAARLSMLNRLPSADRDAATGLLDQVQKVQQERYDLRVQWLQAYNDALNGGASQATASAQAQQKVAAARTTLAGDVASLQSAVESFVQQHPDAATAFPAYGFGPHRGFGPAAGFGPGAGNGPGSGYGLGARNGPGMGYGPGAGYGPGTGYGPDMGYGPGMGHGFAAPYDGHPRGPGSRW